MKGEGLLGLPDDADTKDFKDHLREALEADLTDIDRTGCVTAGRDLKKNLVILMIPSLALRSNEKHEVVFRRMLLLFIKKANEMVEEAYSIVYAHAAIDIMNQYPLIYKFYSILPRAYKKNLQKMYIIHPNYGIKMFFEFARVFLSQKFYSKLCLVDSIYEFQKIMPPTALALPLKFLKKEDDDRGLKYCGFLCSLAESFVPEQGATQILTVCADFMRSRGGITHAGIFRVPGDEGELNLCKVRLQYSTQGSDRIFLSENKDLLLVGDIDNITSINSKPSSMNSKKESGKRNSVPTSTSSSDNAAALLPPEAPTSIIVISNLNTVAQIFKMSIRDLPEAVVPYGTYRELIDLTRRHEINDLGLEWERTVVKLLGALPVCHLSTLFHVISLLREIVAECEVNKMDSKNMAIIFAPTIFRPDMLDPVKAIMELKLAQVVIREVIDRHCILYDAVMHLRASLPSRDAAEQKAFACNPFFGSLPVPERKPYGRLSVNAAELKMRGITEGMSNVEVTSSLETIGNSLSPSMLGRLGGRGRGRTPTVSEADAATADHTGEAGEAKPTEGDVAGETDENH